MPITGLGVNAATIMEVFGSGVTVTVLTVSGAIFTGDIIGTISTKNGRHHDDNCVLPQPPVQPIIFDSTINPEFLLIRLTVASAPYAVGQTVAFNTLLIQTIG